MARIVINTTHSANCYDILSQTPPDYDRENYFLKELQQKVDAEWEYRPNRVNIEYEDNWGQQTYAPIQVVIQSVKSEKGREIADDFRQVVFRDILDSRFTIGSRFRFAAHYNGSAQVPDSEKNVWLSINTDSVKMTSSMIIERCNGTLGSLWKDDQGVSHYHYEPVVQASGLTSVSLMENEVAVSPQSKLTIIAQHNDYTRDYFINQRFIVGYDKVYRVNAIDKFYSNSTFDAENVGLMRMYLEITETSEYDDFEHRIAYQDSRNVIMQYNTPSGETQYHIDFATPSVIPTHLDETTILFTPVVRDAHNETVTGVPVRFSYALENLPETVDPDNYVSVTQEKGTVSLARKRVYLRGNMILTWTIDAQYIESGTEETVSFVMSLR